MRYTEIKEDQTTDRAIRNQARRVMRAIRARADDELQAGAVEFMTQHGWPVCLPIVYTTTMFDNLVVGLGCFENPFAIELRKVPNTLSPTIQMLIALPGGRPFDVKRRNDGKWPQNLEVATSLAYRVLPNYGHFLAGSIRDDPDSFIHEFVHYADFMRGQLSNISLGTHGHDAYVNSPEERNAYYNGAFAKLDKKPRIWFQRPFQRVLHDMWGMMDADFAAALHEPNRRRLVRRFYAVWQRYNQD